MGKVIASAVLVLLVLVAVSLAFFRHTPFSYSGVVEAVEVDVPARLSDVITKLNVDDGYAVTKDEVLAELECGQTNLQTDIARKEFLRAENLLKTGAGSRENYDLRKNVYDNALLAQSWCKITSPLTGKVLYKYYEEGEFIAAGRKLATVSDLRRVNAWVYVAHNDVANLHAGGKATAYLPETGKHYEGIILTVNDEAEFTPKNVQTRNERQRLVFGVKTCFDNDSELTLKPGMTLEVSF